MSVRFEILPVGPGEEQAAELSERVRLTVTCSPKHGPNRTVEVGTRLRALGHAVTVHLSARMVRDRAHLDELLATMAEAGIDDAFVIGGDATEPVGPYTSAVELLPVMHEHPRRPRTLGIAGYPEGHPLIDPATLAATLAEKSRLADYVTTQICFDPDAILRFARRVELPVMVGLPGIVDRRRLLEVSVKVGVGPSLRFLRKQRGLRRFFRLRASADALYDALAPHGGELAGFHFFTFNRLLDTWAWQLDKRNSIAPEAEKEVTPT
jgi:methylenetetrahydrofolate reductase (NADPH)